VHRVVFAKVHLPEIKHEESDEDDSNGVENLKKLWSHKMFVFGLVALLAYEVAEISINSYFINFVTGQNWMDDRTASIVLTCALAFFMVGRFLGSWIMRHVRAEKTLLICAVCTVICTALVLCDLEMISLGALFCNYLFEAIMFPTIFSLSLTGLGNLTKSASSILMMTPVGGCGFLLMGVIADNTNLITPFFIPLIGYMIVLMFAYKLVKVKL
jgi:FHS family L-fucose permease-like MFS transporter